MFYLATNPNGVFVFYFEDGYSPYASSYGSVAFPTKPPKRQTTYKFNDLVEQLHRISSTIIDTDTSYYKLIDRHPEYLI